MSLWTRDDSVLTAAILVAIAIYAAAGAALFAAGVAVGMFWR